jgi:hypothetical protein
MKFYIGQVRLIHSFGDDASGSAAPVLSKIIELSKRKGEVSARDCISSIRTLRGADTAKVRGLFRDLVEGGHGVLTGSGDRVKFQATADDSPKTADKTADTLSAPSNLDTEPVSNPPADEKPQSADKVLTNLSAPSVSGTEPVPGRKTKSADTADSSLSTVGDFDGFREGDRVLYDGQFWKVRGMRQDGRLDLDHAVMRKATSVMPTDIELVRREVAV